MISVREDDIHLIVHRGMLPFLRKERAHVVFKPTYYFWGIWKGNKRFLRNRGLSVIKDKRKYEVWIPLKWYEFQLTKKGREKYNLACKKRT